jgi:protein-disulfide isomerase
MVSRLCSERNITLQVVDISTDEATAAEYTPTSLPTIIYGNSWRIDGASSPQQIKALLDA